MIRYKQRKPVLLTPNPVRDELKISMMQSREQYAISRWEIFDLSGRLIADSKETLSEHIRIDVRDYPAQLYTVRITDITGAVDVYRFLKVE